MGPAALSIALAAGVAGCAGDGADGGAVVVRDSAGVEIVESARPVVRSLPFQVSAEPVVRLGADATDDAHLFYMVTGATRMPDGRIAVLDGNSAQLRFFDGDGRHLKTVGGMGGGPGELLRPSHLVRTAGDSLVVWQHPLGTRSVFAADGAYARRHEGDAAAIVRMLAPGQGTEQLEPLPDGSFVIFAYLRAMGADRPPPGVVYRPPLDLTLVSADLSRTVPLGRYGGFPQLYVHVGGRRAYGGALTGTHVRASAAGSPARLFVGNGDPFEIRMFDAAGVLRRLIRRTDPPRPISDSAWDSLRNAAAAARGGYDEATHRRLLDAIPRQTHWLAYTDLVATTEGGVWVRTPDEDGWTAFDADGRWLGRVPVPYARIFEVAPDYFLALDFDSLNVENIVLHRIQTRR